MPSSKQCISHSIIEEEIYKTFGQFKENKNVKITDFLKKLEVDYIKHIRYRQIKYPCESLFKLVLYQKLKGIKFHTKLTKHLNKNPYDKFKLGFTKTPDRTSIGYFVNHILDAEMKELIDFIANKVAEISEKFNILLDVKTYKPEKIHKETKERNQFYQKSDKTKEICQLFKKRFSPFINLNLKNNTLYKKNQFIDLLIHMGMTRDFAETGSNTFKIYRGLNNPDADTLLYHLKRYPDTKDIHRMFVTLFEIVWEMARKNNLFDIRKHYEVAVDFTEWYFYGDRSAPMIVGKKPDRGTSKCYKFATIIIVEAGKRFTLLALPVGPFDTKEHVLMKLLSYAMERIKIRRVYVDRGFCDSNAIKVFNNLHLKYLMPCTQYPTVKKVLEVAPAPTIIKGFEMKDVTFNLVIVEEENDEGEMVKRAFATNEEYNENDVNLAERLFNLYDRRWGIESSYCVEKHSYLPKTKSKNYQIRLFYFMFAVLLYNLWILADILIWLALFGIVKKDHLLTSKYFGTLLYMTDPGGG